MSENRKEHMSCMVDGEILPDDELMELIKNNDEWRARWQRYHLARMAIRSELSEPLLPDLQSRVSAALENEPVVLAPKRTHRVSAIGGLGKQAAGMAIAATIATVAVLSVQNSTRIENEPAPQQVAIAPAPAAETPIAQVASAPFPTPGLQRIADGSLPITVTTRKLPQVQPGLSASAQSKLSGYLVNHNAFSSRAGMQGIPAYSRIVSITPGEPVANDQ